MKQFQRIYENKGYFENVNFILGENAKDNHDIIDNADPNDWWFHLSNYPSAHCIVEKDKLENADKIFACQLIFSKSKHVHSNKKSKYIYTQIKNIKKTKKLGEVKILKKAEIFNY